MRVEPQATPTAEPTESLPTGGLTAENLVRYYGRWRVVNDVRPLADWLRVHIGTCH